MGLPPFIKTTGGKGLHVVVPIAADTRRKVTWDQAKFSLHTAEALLKKPDPRKDFRKAEAPLRPALKAMG